MDSHALVARNIRRLRVATGLSQEALALEAGVDRSYVSALERGLENPTVSVLDKLARAMKVPIAELFSNSWGGRIANLRPGRRPRIAKKGRKV